MNCKKDIKKEITKDLFKQDNFVYGRGEAT